MMLLKEKFKNTRIILGSQSPRRQDLLARLDLEFETQAKDTDESYPETLNHKEIPEFITKLKSDAFGDLKQNQLLIVSDTIVWFENQALGKPKNKNEATEMLSVMSGKKHEVITSVCLRTNDKTEIFSEITNVYFNDLTMEEIEFYIEHQPPFDKAGAYGIQDWIGVVAINRIEGCFYNVMGLPTNRLYKELVNF